MPLKRRIFVYNVCRIYSISASVSDLATKILVEYCKGIARLTSSNFSAMYLMLVVLRGFKNSKSYEELPSELLYIAFTTQNFCRTCL